MENKIEDLIRDDFHEREIKPSADSFEKLNEKLQNHNRHKRKRIIRIFAYAASVIGLVFIIQYAFKTPGNDIIDFNNGPQDVITTKSKIKDSANLKTPTNDNYAPIVVEQFDSISDKIANTTAKKTQNMKLSKSNKPLLIQDKSSIKTGKQAIANVELKDNETIERTGVAITDTLKKSFITKEITDAELDALLASANRLLLKKGGDSLVINAQRMLYEIEMEINKPLPEKVLLTLRSGAKEIKEIVKPKTKKND